MDKINFSINNTKYRYTFMPKHFEVRDEDIGLDIINSYVYEDIDYIQIYSKEKTHIIYLNMVDKTKHALPVINRATAETIKATIITYKNKATNKFTHFSISPVAKKYNWVIADTKSDRTIYNRGSQSITVFFRSHTVVTCILHPKVPDRKTSLVRQDVDFDTLEKLFSNPRTHTNKGYYNREQRNLLTKS